MDRLGSHFAGLAAAYDRLRPLGAGERRRLALMLQRCPLPAGGSVLEVGCGNGRLLREVALLASPATSVGVDPEPAMLAGAAALGVEARLGRAERLPVDSASIDLAFMHLAVHLVADPGRAARELRRVVRPGGHAAIWTLTPEHVLDHHLNRHFPSLAGIDLERFRPPEELAGLLFEAGFGRVCEQELTTLRRTSLRRLAEAVRARYISTLAMLPEAELEIGARELEAAAAGAPRHAVTYRQRWCLVWARA